MKLVISPIVCAYMTYHNFRYGRKHISIGLLLLWHFIMWGVALTGMNWVPLAYGWVKRGWTMFGP